MCVCGGVSVCVLWEGCVCVCEGVWEGVKVVSPERATDKKERFNRNNNPTVHNT